MRDAVNINEIPIPDWDLFDPGSLYRPMNGKIYINGGGDFEFTKGQFTASGTAVDIDTFVNGLEIASLDPDVQKQRIEKLKSQGENVEKLNQILSVAGLLGGIPAAAASGQTALARRLSDPATASTFLSAPGPRGRRSA